MGARHFKGSFFLRKNAIPQNKKEISLFIAKSRGGGTFPNSPPAVPTSLQNAKKPLNWPMVLLVAKESKTALDTSSVYHKRISSKQGSSEAKMTH